MVDLRLYKASPHQWGPGKTHLVDEVRGTTFCGKAIENGEAPDGPASQITCRGCLMAIEKQKSRDQGFGWGEAWTQDDWVERCGGVP